MSAEFELKTLYKCKWCGKLFATATRHSCKFDPDKRNCLSCAHCVRVEKYVTGSDNAFVCELGVGSEHGYTRLKRIARVYNWKLDCLQWEQIPYYVGSISYVKHLEDIASKENPFIFDI